MLAALLVGISKLELLKEFNIYCVGVHLECKEPCSSEVHKYWRAEWGGLRNISRDSHAKLTTAMQAMKMTVED